MMHRLAITAHQQSVQKVSGAVRFHQQVPRVCGSASSLSLSSCGRQLGAGNNKMRPQLSTYLPQAQSRAFGGGGGAWVHGREHLKPSGGLIDGLAKMGEFFHEVPPSELNKCTCLVSLSCLLDSLNMKYKIDRIINVETKETSRCR